jgi:phosphoglucomutase
VQRAVDRRFNRARYDAEDTVAAFAARLKDEVDLDAVREDLAGVVEAALEPAHVAVWISPRL